MRGKLTLLSLALVIWLALGYGILAATVLQHTVQPGEHLTGIARKYGVTTSQILRENNIANANLLRPGQVLSITLPDTPAETAPTPPPVPTATPVPVATATPMPPAPTPAADAPAQPTAPAQESVPPVTDPTASPAQTATVAPTATTRPGAGGCNRGAQPGDLRYTIRSGDSLYGLASRYNVTVAAIKERNCLTSDVVVVGQLVVIPLGPDSGVDTSTATPRPPATVTPTATPRPTATPTPAPSPTPTRSWLDRLLNR